MAFQIPDHGVPNTYGYPMQPLGNGNSPTSPVRDTTYRPGPNHDQSGYERELPPLPNGRDSYQQPVRNYVNGSPVDNNGGAGYGQAPGDEVVQVEAKAVGHAEVQEKTTLRALDANQVTLFYPLRFEGVVCC
jgi:hypothetical protein